MKGSLRFIGNLLFILFLLIILFAYAMFQGGFVSWFLFYSFLPILLYHFVMILYPLKGWNVTRTLSKRVVRAGDLVHVTIKLERRIPFPLYYGVTEELMPETLNRNDRKHRNYTFLNEPEKLVQHRSIKKMVPIGFRRSIEIPYTLEELPRGEHLLQGVRVLISDVFGFVKREHIFPLTDELIVQPSERDIMLIDGSASYEQGQTAVNTFQLENTNIANGVREYAPGDRFSWIHWKQTAKSQTIMTKEFEQERSNNLLIILDACLPKRRNPLAFEASVELSLSLMEKLDKASVDVGLLTIGNEIRNFSTKETAGLKRDVRYYLTKIQADGGESFSSLMRETMRNQKRLDRLVILTSHLDDFFRQTIQELRLRTSHIVILYIQGSSFVSDREKELMTQMKMEGTRIHMLTENELMTTPLEVSIR